MLPVLIAINQPKGVGRTVRELFSGINLDEVEYVKRKNGRPVGAFGGGGAAGTVSWAAPFEELTMVYMVRQRSDLHVKIAEVVRDSIVD